MPPGGLEQFPDQVPWSVPIFQMSNWWLTIDCRCGRKKKVPLRLLAARIGWANHAARNRAVLAVRHLP